MIVDGTNNMDLAIGQDRRIPQDGDAQIVIPGTINPVLLTLFPHGLGPGAATILNRSAAYSAQQTRTNQAANLLPFATLAKGLYEFEMQMITAFNYAAAAASFLGCQLMLGYLGVNVELMRRIASNGSFVDYNRMRMLLTAQATLNINTDLTGVGQTADCAVIINVIRVL